jgi:tryptophanyl-tRNA synthetase
VPQNPIELRNNTREIAAAFLACGIDPKKNIVFNQSQVAEHAELAWVLNCVARIGWLNRMTQFKDKAGKDRENASVGLLDYPVLMAADILIYRATHVPVGDDQKQHLELARDIAQKFNHQYNQEIFVIPQAKVDESVMIVPGTDGQKMSKSYNNYINIFLPEKELLKSVKLIITDATPLEEPKNPDTCNVFKLYKLLANESQIEEMRNNYIKGGYGYGHAKTALYELILTKFEKPRTRYNELMNNTTLLEKELQVGEAKAKKMAQEKLKLVRSVLGF